jgi:hypothetical protein
LQFIAIVLLASSAAERVDGQAPSPGEPPRPAELIDPGSALPAPPVPGPFVPPGSNRPYASSADAQTAPADNRPAPTYGGQSSPVDVAPGQQPPDISPNHPEKWRYVYRNGGWWYFAPTKQWMYWSDGRWVEYARPAVSNTPAFVQPPASSRPRRRFGMGVAPGYYPSGPSGPYGYGGVGVGVY